MVNPCRGCLADKGGPGAAMVGREHDSSQLPRLSVDVEPPIESACRGGASTTARSRWTGAVVAAGDLVFMGCWMAELASQLFHQLLRRSWPDPRSHCPRVSSRHSDFQANALTSPSALGVGVRPAPGTGRVSGRRWRCCRREGRRMRCDRASRSRCSRRRVFWPAR